mgnify:CR=1 FL=1
MIELNEYVRVCVQRDNLIMQVEEFIKHLNDSFLARRAKEVLEDTIEMDVKEEKSK